jgi:hypothetical protein
MIDINIYLDEAKKAVAMRDALLKLKKNREFKKIFEEGYFKDEAARLARAIANYEMQDEINQRALDEQFRAIGHVQNYMLTIIQAGNNMEALIEEHEERLREEAKETVIDDITGEEIILED